MKRKFVKPRVRDIGDISTIVRGTTTRVTRTVTGGTEESSRRWKMNIKPIRNALSKIVRLRGVSFDWKDSGRHDIGLIAEEVGKVLPEVVSYEENGVDAKSLDSLIFLMKVRVVCQVIVCNFHP